MVKLLNFCLNLFLIKIKHFFFSTSFTSERVEFVSFNSFNSKTQQAIQSNILKIKNKIKIMHKSA